MVKERHPNNLGLADQYAEKLMKFIIGEEMKIKRTKGEKDKTKPLGVGHLSEEGKGYGSKEKKEYSSGN